jgi:uncharacterized protein (UPF0128 family)
LTLICLFPYILFDLAEPVNAEELLRSALRILLQKMVDNKKKTLIGNAVAISPTLALSANNSFQMYTLAQAAHTRATSFAVAQDSLLLLLRL